MAFATKVRSEAQADLAALPAPVLPHAVRVIQQIGSDPVMMTSFVAVGANICTRRALVEGYSIQVITVAFVVDAANQAVEIARVSAEEYSVH